MAYRGEEIRHYVQWKRIKMADAPEAATLDGLIKDEELLNRSARKARRKRPARRDSQVPALSGRAWLPSLGLALEMGERWDGKADARPPIDSAVVLAALASALFPSQNARDGMRRRAFLRLASIYIAYIHAANLCAEARGRTREDFWGRIEGNPPARCRASLPAFLRLIPWMAAAKVLNPVSSFKLMLAGEKDLGYPSPEEDTPFLKLCERIHVDVSAYWKDMMREDMLTAAARALLHHAPPAGAFSPIRRNFTGEEAGRGLGELLKGDVDVLAGAFGLYRRRDWIKVNGAEKMTGPASCQSFFGALYLLNLAPYARDWIGQNEGEDASGASVLSIMYHMAKNELRKMELASRRGETFLTRLAWGWDGEGLEMAARAD